MSKGKKAGAIIDFGDMVFGAVNDGIPDGAAQVHQHDGLTLIADTVNAIRAKKGKAPKSIEGAMATPDGKAAKRRIKSEKYN